MNTTQEIPMEQVLAMSECVPDEPDGGYIADNILTLNIEGLSDLKINKELFAKGVESVSELCGGICALTSVGVTPSKAMDFLIDKEASLVAMDHSYKITKLQTDAAVESAKYEGVNLQKTMI